MFLNSWGMPIGKKTNLSIPQEIIDNHEHMSSFISGFLATDGSLHFKKKHKSYPYYPTIEMTSICPELIHQIHGFLQDQGFRIGKIVKEARKNRNLHNENDIYRIFIYGKHNLGRWVIQIGLGNEKHLNRYRDWKKNPEGGT